MLHFKKKVKLEKKQFIQTSLLKNDLENWFEMKVAVTESLKNGLQKLDVLSKETMIPFLRVAKETIDAEKLYVGLNDGQMIYASRAEPSKGYDPRARDWYQTAISQGKTTITDVFIGASSKKDTISVVTPILKNGVAIGVLSANTFLDVINKKVLETKFEGGYAFIIDRHNKMMIHPDIKLQGKTLKEIDTAFDKLTPLLSEKEGIFDYVENGVAKF